MIPSFTQWPASTPGKISVADLLSDLTSLFGSKLNGLRSPENATLSLGEVTAIAGTVGGSVAPFDSNRFTTTEVNGRAFLVPSANTFSALRVNNAGSGSVVSTWAVIEYTSGDYGELNHPYNTSTPYLMIYPAGTWYGATGKTYYVNGQVATNPSGLSGVCLVECELDSGSIAGIFLGGHAGNAIGFFGKTALTLELTAKATATERQLASRLIGQCYDFDVA